MIPGTFVSCLCGLVVWFLHLDNATSKERFAAKQKWRFRLLLWYVHDIIAGRWNPRLVSWFLWGLLVSCPVWGQDQRQCHDVVIKFMFYPHLNPFTGDSQKSPLCLARKRSMEIGAGSSSRLMLAQHSAEFHTRRSYIYQPCQWCHNYLSVFLIPAKCQKSEG